MKTERLWKIAWQHIKPCAFTWSFAELNYEWKLKHSGKWNLLVTKNMIYLNVQPRTQKDKFRNVHHLVSCCCSFSSCLAIVNRCRGILSWSPANIKGANKDAKIYVGRSMTVLSLLFCSHTLWLNYHEPICFYWLVPPYGVNNCCVLCTVKAKQENKTYTVP